MPLPMNDHAKLWALTKLEARVQLTTWKREQGVEPHQTVIVAMDLRGEVSQGIFDALIDDPAEVASRLAAAKPGEPAAVAVVAPFVEGQIVVEEAFPHLLVELLGRPKDMVPVLTVIENGEGLLTFAEAFEWRPE